jgi:hypothetical protein
MADTDVLADAFAAFTDRVGVEIISPGPAAVRQTIRHRRARGTVSIVAVLALVAVGVLAGTRTSTGTASPSRPAGALETLRVRLVNALPHLPGGFVIASDSAAMIGAHYTNPARDFPSAQTGPVTLYFACMGDGGLNIQVNTRASGWSGDFGCVSDDPGVPEPFVIQTGGGYLYVEIASAGGCVGTCAFAYEIVGGDTSGK